MREIETQQPAYTGIDTVLYRVQNAGDIAVEHLPLYRYNANIREYKDPFGGSILVNIADPNFRDKQCIVDEVNMYVYAFDIELAITTLIELWKDKLEEDSETLSRLLPR